MTPQDEEARHTAFGCFLTIVIFFGMGAIGRMMGISGDGWWAWLIVVVIVLIGFENAWLKTYPRDDPEDDAW